MDVPSNPPRREGAEDMTMRDDDDIAWRRMLVVFDVLEGGSVVLLTDMLDEAVQSFCDLLRRPRH